MFFIIDSVIVFYNPQGQKTSVGYVLRRRLLGFPYLDICLHSQCKKILKFQDFSKWN